MILMENLSVTFNMGFTRPRSAQGFFFGLSEVISARLPSVSVSGIPVSDPGACALLGTGCLWLTSPGLFAQHWLIMIVI